MADLRGNTKGRPIEGLRTAVRLILVALFVFAGVSHFTQTTLFEKAMPAWIPLHPELVLFSGVCEIAGGVGLLPVRTRLIASRCLAVFLVLVFPVNVHMALNSSNFAISPIWLWLRLPLQAGLILAVIWSGRTSCPSAQTT